MCRPHFGGLNLEEMCFLKALCFVYFRHEQMDLGPNPGRNKVVCKLPMLKSDFNLKWYQVFQKEASSDQAILGSNTSCTAILGMALKATPADTAQICCWWCSWACPGVDGTSQEPIHPGFKVASRSAMDSRAEGCTGLVCIDTDLLLLVPWEYILPQEQ